MINSEADSDITLMTDNNNVIFITIKVVTLKVIQDGIQEYELEYE